MELAVLVPLIQGIIAGVPADIAVFNQIKALFDKNPRATITPAELEAMRQTAKTEHEKTQNA
jgi:hypothetical protein